MLYRGKSVLKQNQINQNICLGIVSDVNVLVIF